MIPGIHRCPDKLIRRLIRRYRSIDGFLSEREAVALFRYANRLPAGSTVVEIGSWKGKSTWCLAAGLRRRSRLHIIDPFDAAGEPGSAEIYFRDRDRLSLRELFERNLFAYRDRLEIHPGYSRDFVSLPVSIDLLLIDGDHSVAGARFDFENFEPKLSLGGYIAFHDYYPERADLGPTWVIDRLVRPSGRFTEEHHADSLWIAKKSR